MPSQINTSAGAGMELPPYSSDPKPASSSESTQGASADYGTLATLTLTPTGPQQTAATKPSSTAAATESSRTIQARLIVAADGAGSATRQAAGLRTIRIPYSQRAVVATVATDPHSTAWQRFLTTGPLALLPTRYECHRCSRRAC